MNAISNLLRVSSSISDLKEVALRKDELKYL